MSERDEKSKKENERETEARKVNAWSFVLHH
jgi:hypothetical protein